MKRLVVLALPAVLIASCAPGEAEEALDVGVLRQAALPRTPIATGQVTGSRFGASLGACRSTGTGPSQYFAAGAPGLSTAFLFNPSRVAFAPPDAGAELGSGVLCIGPAGSAELLAYGQSPNAFRRSSGAVTELVAVGGAPVSAMARGDSSNSSPALISTTTGNLFLLLGGVPRLANNDALGHVKLACAHSTDVCVSAQGNHGAKVFSAIDAGMPLFTIDPPGPNRSVSAVAIGDLHPAPGLEVAIAGDGVVDVFAVGGRGRLLYTLAPPSGASVNGFGSSLAVDLLDAGVGFASLWVGSPNEARVYRFYGDAGFVLDELNAGVGSDFGAALAIEANGSLLIGAPHFTDSLTTPAPPDEGAVFRDTTAQWAPLPPIIGVASECDVSAPCRVNAAGTTCQVGTCIGGIACVGLQLTTNCNPLDAGAGDGGTIIIDDDGGVIGVDAGDSGQPLDGGASDGGANDAGLPTSDGGRPDAGSDGGSEPEPDAGRERPEPDAGTTPTSEFRTCGCGSSSLAPLALFGVLLARRRVWSKVSPAR